MLVKELKEILNQVNDNDEVTLYDIAYGERISIDTNDIDIDVRNTFEINFDSTAYITED